MMSRPIRAGTVLLAILAACQVRGGDDEGATPASQCAGELVVSAERLDLGEAVVQSADIQTATLSVTNDSTCDVEISLDITDPDGVFWASMSDPRLAAGERGEVVVTFAPRAHVEGDARLLIEAPREQLEAPVVSLTGRGLAPALLVSERDLSFDGAEAGCTAREGFTLRNEGSAPVVIQGARIEGGGVYLDSALSLTDVLLAPGESAEGAVLTASSSPGPVTGSVWVMTDDLLNSPVELSVHADFAPPSPPSVAEDFLLSRAPPIDVVIAVNTTSSMRGAVAALPGHLAELIDHLDWLEQDYRLVVVTEESGLVAGEVPYLSPGMSEEEVQAVLEGMLDAPGESRAILEMLLRGAEQASWQREDAHLYLLGITDASDNSTRLTVEEYIAEIEALKADPEAVRVIASVNEYHLDCDDHAGAPALWDAAVETGGHFYSSCNMEPDELGAYFSHSVEDASVDQTVELAAIPNLASLEMTLDGGFVSAATGYHDPPNVLRLRGRHDDLVGTLEVRYAPCPGGR